LKRPKDSITLFTARSRLPKDVAILPHMI
jgi:hypothetical protein